MTEILENFSQYSSSAVSFVERIHNIFLKKLSRFNDGIRNTFNDFSRNTISNFIAKITAVLSSTLTLFIKKVPTLFISIVVTIVATCYMSKDYQKLLLFFKGIIGENNYKKTVEIKCIASECFSKFFIGYFWLFVITFSQLLFGFFLLGINHFLVLAFLVALLDLLPVIGTGTILIPWSLFMFFMGKYGMGLGLIFLLIFIVIVRNFSEPKIIGKQTGLNPIFTLVFVFVGLRFGGVFGMLILPMVLTVLFTYYRRKFNED